jgi:hypothetical protein
MRGVQNPAVREASSAGGTQISAVPNGHPAYHAGPAFEPGNETATPARTYLSTIAVSGDVVGNRGGASTARAGAK